MRMGRSLIFILLIPLALAACNFPGGEPTETPTPEPETASAPTIVIESPPSGTSVDVGDEVTIHSTATDDIGVARIDLQVDGSVVRSDMTPEGTAQLQFSLLQTWVAEGPGEHRLSVIAYREDGTPSSPASVVINVVEPVATEAPTAQPTELTECIATATTPLNIRGGPGTVYQVRGQLQLGQSATVIGQNNNWWKIQTSSGEGWVSAPFTTTEGPCGSVPLAAAPPTPVPTITSTPDVVTTEEPVTTAEP